MARIKTAGSAKLENQQVRSAGITLLKNLETARSPNDFNQLLAQFAAF
jgi:ribosomal protein S20